MQQHQPKWQSYTLQRDMKGPKAPAASTIKPTPPPPTTKDAEVRMAKEDALRQERARQGRKSTILAGATDSQSSIGSSKSGSGAGSTVLGG